METRHSSRSESDEAPDRTAGAPTDGVEETRSDRPPSREDDDGELPNKDETAEPDLHALTKRMHGSVGTISLTLMVLVAIVLFYTLYFAKALFLPIVLALVLNFLLSPMVAWLKDRGLPTPIGGAVVLLLFVGLLGVAAYQIGVPASRWVDEAPERLEEVRERMQNLRASLAKVQEATKQIEEITEGGGEETPGEEKPQQVRVDDGSLSSDLIARTSQLLFGGLVLVFLLYFLLAAGDLFLRKLVHVLPSFGQKRGAMEIVRKVEHDLSRYFLTISLINTALGLAVGVAMSLLGMPNPFLWGVVAGLANFVPYIGGVVGVSLIGLVAIVSFDSIGQAMLPPLAYLALNTIEAYLVTPTILGRRLMLNPVAVFIAIIFWGWIWGIAGAILAVPFLVSLKILCDHIRALSAIGEFLSR